MNKISEKLKNKIAQEKNKELGVPHIGVNALAGTGKTTTGVQGILYIKGMKTNITPSDEQQAIWDCMKLGGFDTIRFSSFGKAITDDNGQKLKEAGLLNEKCEARTLNGLGFSAVNKAWGYRKPSSWANFEMIAEEMKGDVKALLKNDKTNPIINGVSELVDYCKQNMISTEEADEEKLEYLADYYDVDLQTERRTILQMVPEILEKSKEPRDIISFTDQVWLPVVLGLPIYKCDLQIIDEAQDLNRMQQELAIKAGHRIMYVGDPRQAIFGFAGADSQSMSRLHTMLGNVEEFPLTVTRRCGKSIVEEAKKYVSNYKAHESNPSGDVQFMKYPTAQGEKIVRWEDSYGPSVCKGDLIVCRVNAPLISQCLKFLASGVYAFILGRKVGERLLKIASDITRKTEGRNIHYFISGLEDWLQIEKEKEQARKHPSDNKIQSLQDHYQCLMTLAQGVEYCDDLINKINDLFPDDTTETKKKQVESMNGIKLSSIHRAKGMEADNVYYLNPAGVGPRVEYMKEWEIQQEENLKYVAITRAKHRLVYVS